jgi:hypothetical protein
VLVRKDGERKWYWVIKDTGAKGEMICAIPPGENNEDEYLVSQMIKNNDIVGMMKLSLAPIDVSPIVDDEVEIEPEAKFGKSFKNK